MEPQLLTVSQHISGEQVMAAVEPTMMLLELQARALDMLYQAIEAQKVMPMGEIEVTWEVRVRQTVQGAPE